MAALEMSNYLRNKVLDHVLRVSSYTVPSALYLALYTSDPTVSDSGTEVSGGSYARQSLTFGAASSGSASNTNTVLFPTATASWGTITHAGIRDASSSGNLLFFSSIGSSQAVASGQTMSFAVGAITVEFPTTV